MLKIRLGKVATVTFVMMIETLFHELKLQDTIDAYLYLGPIALFQDSFDCEAQR